jgi:hypothetical protein
VSNATPEGLQRLSALPLNPSKSHALEMKSPPCPKTRLAAPSLESGGVYSSTRLLPASATKRSPLVSTFAALGKHRLVVPNPTLLQPFEIKLLCPSTKSAVVLVSGWLYSSTRLLLVSAM